MAGVEGSERGGGGGMCCFDFGCLGKWVSVQCNFPGLAFLADDWLQGVS